VGKIHVMLIKQVVVGSNRCSRPHQEIAVATSCSACKEKEETLISPDPGRTRLKKYKIRMPTFSQLLTRVTPLAAAGRDLSLQLQSEMRVGIKIERMLLHRAQSCEFD
jgi:hypothetical protein